MRARIVVNKPADPLLAEIAARERTYRRKWRVPVSEVEEPAERTERPPVGEADWKFVRTIRGLLGVKQ